MWCAKHPIENNYASSSHMPLLKWYQPNIALNLSLVYHVRFYSLIPENFISFVAVSLCKNVVEFGGIFY